MADDLSAIEPWISGLIDRLSAGERRKLGMKLGRLMRKTNAARIARNVDPDGAAMAPRKKREGSKSNIRRKMFPKIRLARALKIRATGDGVAVEFANPLIGRVAQVHHFGDVGFVGKTSRGRTIRTRYTARRLLGFGAQDIEMITDEVLAHLTE